MILPSSIVLQNWDSLIMLCLMYVALVSPYEVAFIDDDVTPAILTFLNYVVTGVFVVDMCLQFNIAMEVPGKTGTVLVKDRKAIAKKYFRTWFTIDFVSIFPFGTVAEFTSSACNARCHTRDVLILAGATSAARNSLNGRRCFTVAVLACAASCARGRPSVWLETARFARGTCGSFC